MTDQQNQPTRTPPTEPGDWEFTCDDPKQIAREAAERVHGICEDFHNISRACDPLEVSSQIILAAIHEAISDDISRRQAEVTSWLQADYRSVPMVVLEVMAKMGCDFNKPIQEPE